MTTTAADRHEAALLKTGALQDAIFNSANFSSIATDEAGVIQLFNVGAERMLGYAASDVLDRITPADISDPAELIARAEALSEELGETITPGFEALVFKASRGIEDIYELTYVRKDGSRFPAIVSVTALRDERGAIIGYLLIGTDNTARKEAEQALLKAGALQSAIFNSANFSSIATDAKGVIQIFNVGAERMLGYTAAEVTNRITPADISDPQELITRARALSVELETAIAPGFEALVFKASRGIEDIYELTYVCKDGTRLPAMVSVTALRDVGGAIIGYLLIGTDNTVRKQIEADRQRLDLRLREKNIELEAATATAEKANLAKSEFLSAMSHELRTPLTAILGFAELMETDEPTQPQRESLEQILKAGWYLLELINEVLDLAVVESGQLSMSLEPVSLADVLPECLTMVESQAQKRSVVLAFPALDDAPFVSGDRTRLKQIIVNLLSNAVKYNVANGRVDVIVTHPSAGRVRLTVRDTGAGLSAEQLRQLFIPFNRLGQQNGATEGTGIGLVVTKRLIELMGGTIGVASQVGVGSEFWVELIEAGSLHLVDQPTFALPAAQTASESAITVLYVEDNPANMKLVQRLIARRAGMRLLGATTGAEGIEVARSRLPTLILMDINLPDMTGLEALEALQADARTAHIPTVALTANAMPRDVKRGLQAGFLRYLTKPIKVNDFMAALDAAIEVARNHPAGTAG